MKYRNYYLMNIEPIISNLKSSKTLFKINKMKGKIMFKNSLL